MTAHGAIDDAVHAIKQGAYDYITKPFPKEKLLGMLEPTPGTLPAGSGKQELRQELHRGSSGRDEIIFRSPAFREVYDLTLQVAESDANILIMGESGTGKELIAGALHHNSPRRDKPFVALNCAALSDTLLESRAVRPRARRLHRRGHRTRRGCFEEADGGTLFLDEIGDCRSGVQAKLLRVLQEREFSALGATRSQQGRRARRGRHQPRPDAARCGRQLPRGPVLPPQRVSDPCRRCASGARTSSRSPAISCRLNRSMKKEVRGIDADALQALLHYEWPGNVRELENVIERAVILARGDAITSALLPLGARRDSLSAQAGSAQLVALDEIERQHITSILKETAFHKSRAAEILGISRKTLDRKIAEYRLENDRKQMKRLRSSIRRAAAAAAAPPGHGQDYSLNARIISS